MRCCSDSETPAFLECLWYHETCFLLRRALDGSTAEIRLPLTSGESGLCSGSQIAQGQEEAVRKKKGLQYLCKGTDNRRVNRLGVFHISSRSSGPADDSLAGTCCPLVDKLILSFRSVIINYESAGAGLLSRARPQVVENLQQQRQCGQR
jgi:hypothetical protein